MTNLMMALKLQMEGTKRHDGEEWYEDYGFIQTEGDLTTYVDRFMKATKTNTFAHLTLSSAIPTPRYIEALVWDGNYVKVVGMPEDIGHFTVTDLIQKVNEALANQLEVENGYTFWVTFEDAVALRFDGSTAHPHTESRVVVAGVESDRLALELNLYPQSVDTDRKLAYADYHVCECVNGEWDSLDALSAIPNYEGILEPSFTLQTTEATLKAEMIGILTTLHTIL